MPNVVKMDEPDGTIDLVSITKDLENKIPLIGEFGFATVHFAVSARCRDIVSESAKAFLPNVQTAARKFQRNQTIVVRLRGFEDGNAVFNRRRSAQLAFVRRPSSVSQFVFILAEEFDLQLLPTECQNFESAGF